MKRWGDGAWLAIKLFVLIALADAVATTILYQNY